MTLPHQNGVRTLFRRDRRFRAACEDYRDAMAARDRFAARDPAKADEHRQLAAEFLSEANAMLTAEHE